MINCWVDVTVNLQIIVSESLGVRGLSCFIEHRGEKVLIDPGVALGYTRWGLHPHPIQAVAGDEVRKKIRDLWKITDYVVFSHMHGDHVPLYNANPFQLSIHHLEYRDNLLIIAPSISTLKGKEKTRLEKIINVYDGRVLTFEHGCFETGPISIYGPYPHGTCSRTLTYASLIDAGEKVMHLSDTELLCDKLVELVLQLKPDIIITDGPPIYRFLNNRFIVRALLRKASRNLLKLSKVAHTIVVDHHVNRCCEGYQWIRAMSRKQQNTRVVTGAEFMDKKPLFLESLRRALYRYYPVDNLWFEKRYGEILEEYRPIYHKIVNAVNSCKTFSSLEELIENILRRTTRG
ncbi:MAG: hypothetical protein F7B59_03515 [Desulfurococcales archaeon]|nr:hypothetical protein [Desulfurococcales archaeon]